MQLTHRFAPVLAIPLLALAFAGLGAAAGLLNTFKQKSDGTDPAAPLTVNSQGRFFGTTMLGGSNAGKCAGNGCGTVYILTPNGTGGYSFVVAFKFTGSPDGSAPAGGVILDAAGNLYGTTKYGGTFGYGTVYELTPSVSGVWTETILYNFTASNSDGAWPVGNLVLDGSGNLYGVTLAGGSHGGGTAFMLSPKSGGGWTETVLHSFFDTLTDGYYPQAGMVLDAAGNLYGTLSNGGAHTKYGAVFELSPSSGGTWKETLLYSFAGTGDGCSPEAALTFDSAGNLYGTAMGCGGTGYSGTVFELSPSSKGWTDHIIHHFKTTGGDGTGPVAPVILDSAGNLYGTTYSGGVNGFGAVYKLTPGSGGTWTESGVHNFSGSTDGANPAAGVILGHGGLLYGTTLYGGADNYGVVYSVNP
jgi:uncharacterized repeat protein (TIGR03803 family)